jgi:hypothetical protein
MNRKPSEVEQAVSRTLRDSLEKLQRTADELNHAVNDLVSACASTRPANALPPMLRAQTSAASLAASLEVLSRFITGALQPSFRPPVEAEPEEPAAAPEPIAAPPITESAMQSQPAETTAELDASNMEEEGAPASDSAPAEASTESSDSLDSYDSVEALPQAQEGFDLESLRPEERELHRRADRVAKVAMQDIKMLRPDQVNLGRERKDLCARLRDDIEKARREYDRRFQTIQGHPVDYFYNRMVEILGGGDPAALGEYPYPSPVLRR